MVRLLPIFLCIIIGCSNFNNEKLEVSKLRYEKSLPSINDQH